MVETATGATYEKQLDVFAEHAGMVEMIKVERGLLAVTPVSGFQSMFVLKGEGEMNVEKIEKKSAFRLRLGQEAVLPLN